MSELPATPTPATVDTAGPTGAHEGHPTPPLSPAESDSTVIRPPPDDVTDRDIMPDPGGSGRALFSTKLGTRPPRNVQGPPFPPVIARSNKIEGVVETALSWRKKYLRLSLCIFPNSGWKIEDFWDAVDIHCDTPEHCQDVLDFIAQDNLWSARKFAEDFSRAHPQRAVELLGKTSMEGIYDPTDPGAIVDKVFVEEEREKWPRPFLWHAAHIMRSTMIDVQQQQKSLVAKSSVMMPTAGSQDPTVTTDGITAKLGEPPVAFGPSEQSVGSIKQGPQPTSGTADEPPPISLPLAPPVHPSQNQSSRRVPSHNQPLSGPYYGQPGGFVTGAVPPPTFMTPNMNAPALRNPKGRPGPGTGPYPQQMHENFSRGPSGGYASRPPSGAISSIHSPHMNPASMAMGQPVMGPPHALLPFPQGHPPMSPTVYSVQPYPPGLSHPSLALGHQMHMPGPSMQPGYVQQPTNNRASRGMSIGDMTNNPYYANNAYTHSTDTRQQMNRRNSFFSGNGALYDPYNGTRPAFNDINASRKYGRGNYADQFGRPRKFSSQDSRPRTSSYEVDRSDVHTGNGKKHSEFRSGKAHMVDILSIVNNYQTGCHQNWIGPENHDVNELFVSDLPVDIRSDEIKAMFLQEICIEPCNVTVKYNTSNGRPHAFALFNSTSDAKAAIRVSDAETRIRGTAVRVTVPRRFYQKPEENTTQHRTRLPDTTPKRDTGIPEGACMSSHVEEPILPNKDAQVIQPLYSPQDARSDLQKKDSQQFLVSDPASSGSPAPRKLKPVWSFPVEKPKADSNESTEEDNPVGKDAVQGVEKDSASEAVISTITMIGEEPGKQGAVCASSAQPTSSATDKSMALSTASTNDKHSYQVAKELAIPTPTAHNGSEDSQLRTALASPKVAPIVNLPAPSVAILTATEQDLVATQANMSPETVVVTEHSTTQEVDGSDDEAGPDTSFTSAQETISTVQPPAETHVDAGPAIPQSESYLAKDGSKLPQIAPPAEPSPSGSLEAQFDVKDSLADANLVNEVSPAQATETQAQEHKPPSSNLTKTSTPLPSASQPSALQSSVSPLSVETARRHGPQQTASLNPFAKPSKTQRQKEKEQQKKEKKKKEQVGKGAKAKLEKASSLASLNGPTAATPTGIKEQAPTATSDIDDALAQITPATEVASVKEAPATDKGKGKAKVQLAVEEHPDRSFNEGGKEGVLGKHGGTTTKNSNETGSVTQKAKMLQRATGSPTKQNSSAASALPSRARCPSPNLSSDSEQSGGTTSPRKIAVKDAVKSDDGPSAPKATTIKNAPPAVPLNLYPRKPSALSQSSSTSPHPTPSNTGPPTARPSTVHLADLQDMSQNIRKSDTVSIASSDTLHPDDPAQPSPSPTADDFYTPLQTPAVPPTAQDQAPKLKKKNKKKKKKAATTLEPIATAGIDSTNAAPGTSLPSSLNPPTVSKHPAPSSPDSVDHSADPFADQMSHIDSVRKSNKESKHYYNRTDQDIEAKGADEKVVKEKAEKKKSKEHLKFDQQHWRQIQAFLYENPCLLPDNGEPIE